MCTNQIIGEHWRYLAEAIIGYLFIPSHKWDGNEIKIHCRWFQPTDKKSANYIGALAKRTRDN